MLLAEQRMDALLVVLPDLPLVTASDIAELIAQSTPRSVVLAPDRHGQGTNALLARPADALPFAFGEGSFDRHRAAAQHAQLAVHEYRAQGTAFDVDIPDDMNTLHTWTSRADMDLLYFSVSRCLRGA
jgi:2-phospho-L-lactate guanylyltransferase